MMTINLTTALPSAWNGPSNAQTATPSSSSMLWQFLSALLRSLAAPAI